ncbi:4-hydroxy-tetrahydrodipicolinate synthase [Ottowia sp.]|uniref:4-hydroxy-tetrahydrodipicolinate synthase n=1 Tax=Ottowia sp. TaxID=1898956 RepID=UPI0039E2AC6F
MNSRISSQTLKGIFPALATPVTADGQVDAGAVKALMAHLKGSGIRGAVPLGGTGEYGAASRSERSRMVSLVREHLAADLPVIAGVLDPGFYDAMDAGKALAAAGADALMVLTPYYTNPTQQGIRDYFLRYADESPLPVVIYEIPYRTRIAIAPEVLHELSRHENIIGMKACNTDMYHFLKVVAGVASDFSVLSGEDTLLPVHMAAGAQGGIVVTANLIPRTWNALYQLLAQGRTQEALLMHRQLMPLMDLAFAETNPGPMKAVWDLIGVHAPYLLAPLVTCNPDLAARLRKELQARLASEAQLN